MRDDLPPLFDTLARALELKHATLTELLNSDRDKLHYLAMGNLNHVLKLIRKDHEIRDRADICDYDIRKSKEALCAVTGWPIDDFNDYIEELIQDDDPVSREKASLVTILTNKTNETLRKLLASRKKLIAGLSDHKETMGEYAEELDRISRFDIRDL